MRWKGTDAAGSPINLAFNSYNSSCYLKYYTRQGDAYYQTKSASITCTSPYENAYVKVAIADGEVSTGLPPYYAKEGRLTVCVDRTGTNNIQEGAFVFAYGHTTVVVQPSFSLPTSFGISFSSGTNKMAEEAVRMSSSGAITTY